MPGKFLPDVSASDTQLTGGALSSRPAGLFSDLDREIARARNITRVLEIAEDIVGGVALFAAIAGFYFIAWGMS